MEGEFDPEFRTSTDDVAARVLYVDDDEATMAALTDYVEDEHPDVGVLATTDPDAAAVALRSRTWDCLVVGGDLPEADRRRVAGAASCRVVTFTAAGRDAESDPVVAIADSMFEKGTDERILSLLVAKAREYGSPERDDGIDAPSLASSLDGDGEIACFLVDEGDLVWSSERFESVFPVRGAAEAGDGFEDRLAAVFGTSPDGSERYLTVESEGRPDENRTGAGQRPGTRYYRHDRHALPADTAGARLDVFEDVTEHVEREARSRMHELLVEQAGDGLYVFDDDGVIEFCNEAFADMLGYETDELVGKHAAEIFAEGELHAALRDVKNVVDSDQTGGAGDRTFLDSDGDPVPVSVNYTVLFGDETAFDGFVCVARDVTERRKRERELAAHRDELARINRADALVQNVVRELGQVSTRDELERAVCECLVDVDGVTMAWFGKREGANHRIVPGTVLGGPEQYLREALVNTSSEDVEGGPVLSAVRSGEVQVVDDVREDELVSPWRDLSLSHGIESLAMVPLGHGETVHGVLAVYGDEPDVFSEAMAERFGLLGDTIGFAVTAVQNKRLIEQDVTVELEFRADSEDACLVWLARACDCRLETVGSVDLGEDVLQYLAVDGAAVDAVADAALAGDQVQGTRVVRSEQPDAGVIELRTASSLQTVLSDAGARLEEAVVTASGTRMVVEVPSDGDLRAIHEVVRRSNPGAELVTKTEGAQRDARGNGGQAVTDALTDRQREILQAAHLAGYYAWPRDTTAEELADSLDIASPTLHQHLRRAEHNILAALFDE